MTKSLSLVGLPIVGATAKPHHYKQKVQKMTDLPKTWVLRVKQFEGFRRKKNRNFILDLLEKPSELERSRTSQLNKALVSSRK